MSATKVTEKRKSAQLPLEALNRITKVPTSQAETARTRCWILTTSFETPAEFVRMLLDSDKFAAFPLKVQHRVQQLESDLVQ